MQPPSYPARPTNGGALECALPKVGTWSFEPKYNGWRALIHVPTGRAFTRYLTPLTIERELKPAIDALREQLLNDELLPRRGGRFADWIDAEALNRRSKVSGTLMVLDFIPEPRFGDALMPYIQRHELLKQRLAVHRAPQEKLKEHRVYLTPSCPHFSCAGEMYAAMKSANHTFGEQIFEGIVAKRIDKPYPVQMRSATVATPWWIKHRFDQ